MRSILGTTPGCSSCQCDLARAARVVAVVAAGHHVADARLLVAVVVVVARGRCRRSCRRSARSCCGSCGRSVRGSCRPGRSARRCRPGSRCVFVVHLRPLPSLDLQALHARVADGEVELAVRADEDAVDAVVVVEAAEAGEELLRRAVGLAVAVLVLEDAGCPATGRRDTFCPLPSGSGATPMPERADRSPRPGRT